MVVIPWLGEWVSSTGSSKVFSFPASACGPHQNSLENPEAFSSSLHTLGYLSLSRMVLHSPVSPSVTNSEKVTLFSSPLVLGVVAPLANSPGLTPSLSLPSSPSLSVHPLGVNIAYSTGVGGGATGLFVVLLHRWKSAAFR